MQGYMTNADVQRFNEMREHEAKNGPFFPQPIQPKVEEQKMTQVPENEVTQADINKWYELQAQLKSLKASEMLLRTKIYKGLFKDPVEGTNTIPLAEGWVMKAKRVIQRDIDVAALTINSANPDGQLGHSRLELAGINVAALVKWKPELVLKNYRELTDEQKLIFNDCLVIKDGSPALEIVLPAKNKTE